jgi:drug/metabolite transporter (DMT)-like permease
MTKRKRSTGELISSFVFFFAGLWLIREGQNLFAEGAVLKGIFVALGGALFFAAAFRFQIQRLFNSKKND